MTRAAWLLVAILGLTGLGCKDGGRGQVVSTTTTPSEPAVAPASWRDEFPDVEVVPPGSWSATPLGVPTWVVEWLDRPEYASLRATALDEIDATAAELDTRFNLVPPGTIGPPPGWKVVGMDPGAFSFAPSPTGLAAGYTDFHRATIYVSWRPTSSDPRRFPALGHEYGHAWAFVLSGGDVVLAAQYGHPATLAASPDDSGGGEP